MRTIVSALAFFAAFAAPAHGQISIDIDTSLADRTLALVCSSRRINEAEIRRSPVVQAQIEHNSGLTPTATMDAYVAALRAASACQAPTPDPFGIGDVIANVEIYRQKVAAIQARREELAAAVARRLAPYAPANFAFNGSVVLAVPYFSCGGFAAQGAFFIDLRCLSADINQDALALELLVTHETFHAMQRQLFHPTFETDPQTQIEAYRLLLDSLLTEGSAEFVANSAEMRDLPGGGLLTRIGREFSFSNGQRVGTNFAALAVLFDYVANNPETPRDAARRAYTIGFTGSFQQFGYYVGAAMARSIEQKWGPAGVMCVMRLPSEQFVLAYRAIAAEDSTVRALDPAIIRAAEAVRDQREGNFDFSTCRPA